MSVTSVNYGSTSKPVTDPAKLINPTCMSCRIKFESTTLQREHFKTDWHLYNLKRKVCKFEPIDLTAFNLIKSSAPTIKTNKALLSYNHEDGKLKNGSRFSSSQTKLVDNQIPQASSKKLDSDSESDWSDCSSDNFEDGDYDEDEAEEMLGRVVKSDVCLFCEKKSKTLNDNVTHMNNMHGFFIPEEQYLIDLEGLMEYLGFKVGAGATCIWCNKQFTSLHGVRLHMLYKDHCKIMFDQDKAVDEFKEFYDYSNQKIIPMKPLNQLMLVKRRNDKKAEYNKALARTRSANYSSDKQLGLTKKGMIVAGSYQAKNIKKFNAYHAKILLRTGMSNNQTMRGRIRQQNPI